MLQRGDVYYNLTDVDSKYQFEIKYQMRISAGKRQSDRILYRSPIGDAVCPHDISGRISLIILILITNFLVFKL